MTSIDRTEVRFVAVATCLLVLVGAVCAIASSLALYADGSWFVFTLSVGAPWSMNFVNISGRATAYLLTIVPAQAMSSLFKLDAARITMAYGLSFYGVQLILLCTAVKLAWRDPSLLLIVLVQNLLGVGILYGFPSEILISANILWIAAYLAVHEKQPGALFSVFYTLLVFSHELALPSAFVIGALAFRNVPKADESSGAWRRVLMLVLLLAPLVALVLVKVSGGGKGSDFNAVYVFDVIRIAKNPTLIAVVVSAALCAAVARSVSTLSHHVLLAASVLVGVLVVVLLAHLLPNLNFAAGRYPARSVTGFSMFALAILFAAWHWHRATTVRQVSAAPSWVLPAFCGAAAAAFAANTMFLVDWQTALAGDRRLAAPAATATIVSYDEALQTLSPGEAAANRRTNLNDFTWVMPYRTLVLADGSAPTYIPFGWNDGSYCTISRYVDQLQATLSQPALTSWREYTCAHPNLPAQISFWERLKSLTHLRR